jgi:thiamine monophosphate synthase
MGRKRKRGPLPPSPARKVTERMREFAESPAARQIAEAVRNAAESPAVREATEKARKYTETETARKLREAVQRFQQEEPSPRNKGGRPPKLTPKQITAGITLLGSRSKMKTNDAYALLREKLKLGASVSDSSLYRMIVSKVYG